MRPRSNGFDIADPFEDKSVYKINKYRYFKFLYKIFHKVNSICKRNIHATELQKFDNNKTTLKEHNDVQANCYTNKGELYFSDEQLANC